MPTGENTGEHSGENNAFPISNAGLITANDFSAGFGSFVPGGNDYNGSNVAIQTVEKPAGATHAVELNYDSGNNLLDLLLSGFRDDHTGELFIRFKSMHSTDFIIEFNHKLMRLTDRNFAVVNNEFLAGGPTIPNPSPSAEYFRIGQMTFHAHTCFGGSVVGTNNGGAVTKGAWYEHIFRVKMNTQGNYDGILQYWRSPDGTPIDIDVDTPLFSDLGWAWVIDTTMFNGNCTIDPYATTYKWDELHIPHNVADAGSSGSYFITHIEVWNSAPAAYNYP